MSFGTSVYLAPPLLTGAISLALAVYVFRRQSPVLDTRGLVAYLAASGVVALVFVAVVLAHEESVMRFLLNVAFTTIVVGALALFQFSLAFAGRLDLLTRPVQFVLGAASAAVVVAMWTDHIHGSFRADVELYTEPVRILNSVYGPTGQFGLFVLFGLTITAAYFILAHLLRSETLYRMQGLMITTAVVLPGVGSALSVANWPDPAINLTPVFTTVAGVIYTVAITRYGFLDVVPLAHEEIVDSMDDHLVVTDPTDTVLSVNSPARDLIDEPDPIGRPVGELSPVSAALAETEAGNQHRPGREFSVERDGTERIFDVQSVPIQASDGRALGRAITLREITDLKRRERRLRRQNERLDQFASIVSHDLRNPLNVAQLRNDMVTRAHDDDNARATQEALDRMESIIDEMLSLARAGRDIESPEPCRLATVAENAWANVRTPDSELDSRFGEMTVDADSTRLTQLFENLFRNAVDHNDPPLTVRVGRLDTDAGFYIEDDGTGIPPGERADVFDPGYTTSEDGSGLGLAIVGDIVDAHGWAIAVTGGDDGGARFEVRTD